MPLARRDEDKKVNPDINVTPMVDVMLVLLIIFMVVTPMLRPGVLVDLAETRNPVSMADADKQDAVVVAVNREGKIFLGTERVTLESLAGGIKSALDRKMHKKVFLKSDARAKYGIVADVVDNIRSAGVDQVGLLTEQKKFRMPSAPWQAARVQAPAVGS
jgi:biopolymer transport protein ExbD/biopolymer transport protein TolR